MAKTVSILAVAACAVALAACSHGNPTALAAQEAAAPADAAPSYASRLAGDAERDARRKASETLAFMQIRPGQTVFEMEAGGGYWTELFSHHVGVDGAVIMQNPAAFVPFVEEELARRFTEGRLPNVHRSLSMFDALEAQDASVDLITWVQGPHELFYTLDSGETLGDPAGSYAEIFRVLKPGGAFVVIDHAALAGAPSTTGQELHRIDPAIVVASAQQAGFTLEARADFLANPEDPHTNSVFDPAIRGQTDQFALRFRKPM